jgi:desulfoferrodoxin (superoxide reductase-like protein)
VKKVFLSMIFTVMVLANLSVYAHPPSDIIITYDTQTKVLHAVVMHNTMNTVKHYIKKVEVALNNKLIITQMFALQGNNVSQDVTYIVPDAKIGDKISVEGECNISGELKKEIIVK